MWAGLLVMAMPALGLDMEEKAVSSASPADIHSVRSLRLVPFPKEIRWEAGTYSMDQRLILETVEEQAGILGEQIAAELKLSGLGAPEVHPLAWGPQTGQCLSLSARTDGIWRKPVFRDGAGPEDYVLQVRPDGVTIAAPGGAGLFYGVQTLRQLMRANRQGHTLPCLTIRDWPSIPWRAFQDDLTRGPSSTLENLRFQAGLGSFLKQNVFTYYMEHQYAFQKHPSIGPKDGSLTPDELRALVAYAKPLHLNILGNQQSFGHFTAILAHPEYAELRETPYLLSPAREGTYRLLDEMYSEELPLLPFPFFNVCCDETEGLGQGPSKALASEKGVGGVYVQHILRLHDLVVKKYRKRMLMWGDIILNHPDHLKDIPKDTIMLTWGYEPQPSFEAQILPFARSGYDFFVCPGVRCWNRVLPQFSLAVTNIRNFVRDGAKHGAIGVLTTVWDDDGENFNAPNWHGIAWGAECAWNASSTSPEDFNRRIGAVLFGERGDEFGQAIQSLSAPRLSGLPNATFWKVDTLPLQTTDAGATRRRWEEWQELARAASARLEACRKEARVNAESLDFFSFGARRLESYGQRRLDRLTAAEAYREAWQTQSDPAILAIVKAEDAIRDARDGLQALSLRFAELWRRENKPYALDWTLDRYRGAIRGYDELLEKLKNAREAVERGHVLPPPAELGLEIDGKAPVLAP